MPSSIEEYANKMRQILGVSSAFEVTDAVLKASEPAAARDKSETPHSYHPFTLLGQPFSKSIDEAVPYYKAETEGGDVDESERMSENSPLKSSTVAVPPPPSPPTTPSAPSAAATPKRCARFRSPSVRVRAHPRARVVQHEQEQEEQQSAQAAAHVGGGRIQRGGQRAAAGGVAARGAAEPAARRRRDARAARPSGERRLCRRVRLRRGASLAEDRHWLGKKL